MDMAKMGTFLADLRKEQKLTQAELGEKLGVTNKTISRWETGSYMPPVEMLEELSRMYDLTINELLSGKKLSEEEYKEMGNLSKEINDKNGFLVKLRNENYFDADMFKTIKDTIVSDSSKWRMTGSVPLEDVVALAYLIDQLAGGSRFLDEYTADQVEDANLEILRLLDSTLFTV